MSEIRSLTGIRGIAALYVAFHHSLKFQDYTGDSAIQIFINHGFLSVDLFFILSGYVMALSSGKQFIGHFTFNTYFHFMRKRFARIYPMYFIVLCLGFFVLDHFAGKINFLIGITLLSVIFANNFVVYHLWSLSSEWVAYLLFPAFIKISYAQRSQLWTVLLICVAMLGTALEFHLDPDGTLRTGYPLLRCFPAYILGILSYKISQQYPTIVAFLEKRSIVTSVLLLILLFLPKTELIIIFLLFLLVISISTDRAIISIFLASKAIYFLGSISYSIYLIHPFFDYALKYSYTYINSTTWVIFGNALYIATTISLSYFSYKLIEIPAQKFINTKLGLYKIYA